MKLYAALAAFAAAQEIQLNLAPVKSNTLKASLFCIQDYDASSMLDPSTSDYEYENYDLAGSEQFRGPFGAPIKDFRGSCMICNVEGETGPDAFQKCLDEAKFIHCRNDHGSSPEEDRNVCMVTERRNNGRTQLNIRCQEKQACKRDQKQNASQCREYGEKDRKISNF